jgi:hypothetical protein
MSDVFKLVGTLRPAVTPQSPPQSGTERSPGRGGDAADGRPALDAALARLDQVLRSGIPPRADAPRGTYLNVVV